MAYLAGHAEGNPLGRVVAVNLEQSWEHIEPRHLRDVLLPTVPFSSPVLTLIAEAVTARVAATRGPLGKVREKTPRWLTSRPVYPPNSFVGRWKELWWLHSALHPHIGPLTSRPTTPIAVVHGAGGIGKTALAAEYIRRFGTVFSGGILWRTPKTVSGVAEVTDGEPRLWVLDAAAGGIDDITALLPPETGVPCLVLTRDARLSHLGNSLPLGDLTATDSIQLIAAYGVNERTTDPVVLNQISTATAGSPGLREQVAALAGTVGAEASLNRLQRLSPDLLRPLEHWLAPELAAVGEQCWDVLRVLAAASPTVVPILRIADILAATRSSDRVHEIVGVQQAVSELLARGILAAAPDAVELTLPSALVLALRQLDHHPHRAEQLRVATLHSLLPRPHVISEYSRPPRHHYSDEEQRAAHRIQIELLNRITGHPSTIIRGPCVRR